jgi:predicted nucleic acid-binding protein
LDVLSQIRVRLEAEAILSVLDGVENGEIELISSTVLELEISRIPLALRREHGEDIIGKASTVVIVSEAIEKRAERFTRQRIKPMDALHLAAAESALVDYFCTCDDAFLRRAKEIVDLRIVVVSPLELIEVLEK